MFNQHHFLNMQKQDYLSIKALLLAGIILACTLGAKAQYKDSIAEFKFSAYVDAYYARYSDQSIGLGKYEQFGAISPVSNQFGLNIAQLSAQYTHNNVRSIFTIHYGDLPTCAWSPQLNLIQEANAGIKIGRNLWLDAGLFKTHIGTEALLPKDNITSSVTVITLYEPWFQAGARLTYTPNDKLTVTVHALNGYNSFVDQNKKKSFGVGLSYNINEKCSLGYYILIGDALPDSLTKPHTRFLNNFVFNYQFTPKFRLLAGFDYIGQQNSSITDSSKYASVLSAIITLQYKFLSRYACYGRFELFNDPDGFLAGKISPIIVDPSGYKVKGFTLGLEDKVSSNSYIRLEGRELVADPSQQIFLTDGKPSNIRYEGMICIGVWF
jgi:hypothetical protein